MAAHTSHAQIVLPTGLEPGDTYHLVFNSSLSTPALSTDIGFYNAVAQGAADAAGIGASQGIAWRALGSTGGDDARDNAVVAADTPVYNMQGELVATGYVDLWDGTVSASLAWNEYGQSNTADAWTGTTTDGMAAAGLSLGDASQMAWCGRPTLTDAQWINYFTPALSTPLHVYALSEELRAPWSAATLAGDYNGDGKVGPGDYTVWRNSNGQNTTGPADGNNDGRITQADYIHWKDRYGDLVAESNISDVPPATTAVPEPPTWMIALLAVISLWTLSYKRA